MSGEGSYPFNTRLLGNGVNTAQVFSGTVVGESFAAIATDHFFEAATPPGGVCIAALMNATAIVRPNLFGVAIQ